MIEKLDEIKHWIIKADHDLGTAKITYIHIPEYLDTVTYHCQQAVEKYLKGYCIFLSITFRRTHDLIYLLDLITQKDNEFEKYYDLISELQGYATEVRYPNETIYLSPDKIEKAMEIARMIRELVIKKIEIDVKYNQIIDQ